MTRFLVVPQWQGSPSARAMQLVEGAQAIAGDLPRSACTVVEVPLEAGDAQGSGVSRLSALVRTREAMAAALADVEDRVVVVGGDGSVALGGLAHALRRHPATALVWADASASLQTPDSSPTGAFAGMALRSALGEGEERLAVEPAVAPERTVLVGARDLDPAEEVFFLDSLVRRVPVEALSDPDMLAAAVAATGAATAYVHVDLSVLDPAAITGVGDPVPFGAAPGDLVRALGALRERTEVVGASLSGFAPASAAAAVDDLGTILRLIGALA